MDEKELNIERLTNYSKEDGSMVRSIETRGYKTEKINIYKCANCEFENENRNMYCKCCGSELYTIEENKKVKNNRYIIKQAMKISITSVLMLLVVSAIYKTIIFMEGAEINELVNPLHILLAMNLGEVNIFTTSVYSSNSATIQLGMIVMIILPIIALSISNLIFMNKYSNSIKSIASNSVFVGIVYGCILGVLSIFSKNRVNMGNMYMYTSALVYGFTLFSVITNGFILGFISTFVVGIFRTKDKTINIGIAKLAIKTVGVGVIFMLLILTTLSLFNKSFIHDLGLFNYVNRISLGVILIQLSVYLWAFANLIPIAIGSISLSILGIGSSDLLIDTKLLLIALIFVSILILIVVGNKLKIKYGKENINIIKKFSTAYALAIGVLSILTKIVVEGNSAYSLEMGFGLLISMVVSYLYSYVVTLIGYKLS